MCAFSMNRKRFVLFLYLVMMSSTYGQGLHSWSKKSAAAYLQHVKEFRTGQPTDKNLHAYWNKYRPAFVCPWLDRVGRVSEGGKFVCNWQSLLGPRPLLGSSGASDSPAADAPCVIYSFGISGESSFEEDLMGRLKGSGCKLWGHDPSVNDFPVFTGGLRDVDPSVTFSKTALVAESVRNATLMLKLCHTCFNFLHPYNIDLDSLHQVGTPCLSQSSRVHSLLFAYIARMPYRSFWRSTLSSQMVAV